MLSKCANPSCSTQLVYLREGKIFMVEAAPAEGPLLVKPAARVEHFWLCGPCSADFTVTYSKKRGMSVVPKQPGKVLRAAAS